MEITNREFKFRVWDIKRKCFLQKENHEHAITGGGKLLVSESDWYQGLQSVDVDNYIIQQFTGRKDKNNKEIYEGDIVKTNKDHLCTIDVRWVEYTKGVITWVCQSFKVCQWYIGANLLDVYAVCDCCPCGLEIIGHVCENPELLKNE